VLTSAVRKTAVSGARVRLLALAATGLAAVGLGSPALAAAGPDPWQVAAARVNFPVYRPSVTLGFAPGPVVVERCGSSGNTWVRASYSKGPGDPKAVFGFDESYPQHCGDAGERMTVASAGINGVTVEIEVYCYSPGPKCTVEDGFANGFHVELRGAGPKQTLIGVYSTHVRLPDLLKMLRSLTAVAKTSSAPAPVSPAAGSCSKSEATRVVEQLHLGNANDPGVPNPVTQALCGPFFGPGSQAMAASLTIPSCGRTAAWVVFRRVGRNWQLVLSRNNGADLEAVGSGIRETMFVLRPGDAHCFPTGGTRSRTWRWNGTRFTASAWKHTAGAPASGSSALPSGLKTPSGNIVCVYWLRTSPPAIGCRMKSGLKPKPATDRPGCPRTEDVTLRATGRPTIGGRSICPGEDEGDAGPLAYEATARVLAYGKTWSGGGLRCSSATTGLTCRNKSGHGFFLSRERWRAF
jgi:hypothetical protein